jgi:hypothetical protein
MASWRRLIQPIGCRMKNRIGSTSASTPFSPPHDFCGKNIPRCSLMYIYNKMVSSLSGEWVPGRFRELLDSASFPWLLLPPAWVLNRPRPLLPLCSKVLKIKISLGVHKISVCIWPITCGISPTRGSIPSALMETGGVG